MKWSEKAWQSAKPVYDAILKHPFIKELISGVLSKEVFIFYIRQDAVYLSDYGKILTGIASKLSDPAHIEAFVGFAGDSLTVEKALHESFIRESKNGRATEASPSCLLYTSVLWKQLGGAPVEVALAAVLPCFRIYKEVGDYILANQTEGNNPYQSWIDTYGGEDFEKSVTLAVSICDQIAAQCTEEQQQAMTKAFITSARLEWLFWDSAYRQERWLI
ncbi:MAG: TenA family protein [Proteiniphilum sp.]|jgi:thiaminase/transcriptional activator TenA|nr:TenA family protein [Proteiniphilum sp.]